MFRLHDSTRRQICTAAFNCLCLLPTIGVCGWTIARHLPWDRQAEEARLSGEMGVTVSIQSMAHTLPGVVRYTGLKLTDPETGTLLLYCGELEATRTLMPDSRGESHPAIRLVARRVESGATAWPRLKEVLCRSLECQNGRPEVEVRATADAWTLHDGSQSQLLVNVVGGIGINPAPPPIGVQALLDFQVAGGPTSSLVEIGLLRDREAMPPVYRYYCRSESGEVPPSVAALIRSIQPTDGMPVPVARPGGELVLRPSPDRTMK
jgi:hypothetical protein